MRKSLLCRMLALTIALATGVQPASTCANYYGKQYSWEGHPSYPTENYCKGHLGVVIPSYDGAFLFVAYRYFSGKALSSDEVEEANGFLKTRDIDASTVDQSDWTDAREKVMGKVDNAEVDCGGISSSGEVSSTICNIQTNAFVTAAKTLNSLIAKYGATSAAVKEWIAAQDMVFGNGSGKAGRADGTPIESSIPKPLLTGDKILQQDRAYQIAAANFYAMNFDQALEEFTKIASDKDSPWSNLSRYLAVRCMIRNATVSKDPFDADLLKEAQKTLKALLVDHSMAGLRDDLLDLADFVAVRLEDKDPSLLVQRARKLAEAMRTEITGTNLKEYNNVVERLGCGSDYDLNSSRTDAKKTPLLVGADDATDWIDTFGAPAAVSRAHALARWKERKSWPWLIAALHTSKPGDADAQLLLDAAAKVKPMEPAFATVSYERANLLIAKKQCDLARSCIDIVLSQKGLDLSSRNNLLELRLGASKNLDEFARDSVSKAVGHTDNTELEDSEKHSQDILPAAENIYDEALPLSIFKLAAESKRYSYDNRKLLAKMAWVRAVVLGNDTVARALANDLETLDKDALADVNRYLQASTPAEKKFAAAIVMLSDESCSPSFERGGSEPWSPSWWRAPIDPSSKYDNSHQTPAFSPPFLSAAERAAATDERARLRKIPPAPAYLAAIVVAFAKANPNDKRVPQALHRAVRCTRYGEQDKESARLSKEAFMILHHKYAKSQWAIKTPYYF